MPGRPTTNREPRMRYGSPQKRYPSSGECEGLSSYIKLRVCVCVHQCKEFNAGF